jgi:hypothetical protein
MEHSKCEVYSMPLITRSPLKIGLQTTRAYNRA